MKKGCLSVFWVFAGLLVLGAGLIWFNFYAIHARYRLTVEVQDGDEIKIGSSVIDVGYAIQPDWVVGLGGYNTHPTPVGYSPTVDLGKKGLLFLTFNNAVRTPGQIDEFNKQVFCLLDDMGCLLFAAYSPHGTFIPRAYSQQAAALKQLLHNNHGPRDVPLIALPSLVRFGDINNPNTLTQLSPYDLSASFGPGVTLKRVTLELTDDPVTPPPAIWPQWLKTEQRSVVFKGYDNSDFRGYER